MDPNFNIKYILKLNMLSYYCYKIILYNLIIKNILKKFIFFIDTYNFIIKYDKLYHTYIKLLNKTNLKMFFLYFHEF